MQSAVPTGQRRDIPGPRGLTKWRLLPELAKRPHEVLRELTDEYGDIVRLSFPRETFVLLANPDYVEHVSSTIAISCIGLKFALMEGQLILATLAQTLTVRLTPGHVVVPAPRLNLPPKFGLRMMVLPRQPLAPAAVDA
jgi:cytochrome P450